MKTSWLKIFAVGIACACGLSIWLMYKQMQIIAADPVVLVARCNVGNVIRGMPISAEWSFLNNTETDWEVTAENSGCGCIRASINRDHVPPGEVLVVKAVLDSPSGADMPFTGEIFTKDLTLPLHLKAGIRSYRLHGIVRARVITALHGPSSLLVKFSKYRQPQRYRWRVHRDVNISAMTFRCSLPNARLVVNRRQRWCEVIIYPPRKYKTVAGYFKVYYGEQAHEISRVPIVVQSADA